MTAPSPGKKSEWVPVSLGAVAKVKPSTADPGPGPPLGLGREPDSEGEHGLKEGTLES